MSATASISEIVLVKWGCFVACELFGYDTHYSFSIAYGYLRRIFRERMLYELVAMLRVIVDT